MENDKVYRIKDIRTKRYSIGNLPPLFSDGCGKVWDSLEDIKSHIQCVRLCDEYDSFYRFCVIEILELKKIDIIEIDQIMEGKEK